MGVKEFGRSDGLFSQLTPTAGQQGTSGFTWMDNAKIMYTNARNREASNNPEEEPCPRPRRTAQTAVRRDPQMRAGVFAIAVTGSRKAWRKWQRRARLAVRLYWMLRTQMAYPEIVRIESSPRVPLVGAS